MANDVAVPVSVVVDLPKGLKTVDFDRKIVMAALRQAAKNIQKESRNLLKLKRVSKEGEVPGRLTGRLFKSVKVHASKRKDRYWAKTQIDSFEDGEDWYPAPLFYGRKDGSLKPRLDPVSTTGERQADKNAELVQKALESSLKGWF